MESVELAQFLNKYKSNLDIYHDLMIFRIREILLVASVYDAYILEQEGELTERIFGEYYNLNLSTAPRITSVHSTEDALKVLQSRNIDLIIHVARAGGRSPFLLAEEIRSGFPDLPQVLLLADNSDTSLIHMNPEKSSLFDHVFVWNGDSSIFLAIIKCIEDQHNVENDTRIGNVRIILMVEDSVRFYSRYLFVLYSNIIRQTQELIEEEKSDALHKMLRMRARPKVLLVNNYEHAIGIIDKYSSYLLSIISDVAFPVEGKKAEDAGRRLVQYARGHLKDLPICLQSSNPDAREIAKDLHCYFIHKNSPTLSEELTNFIRSNLGFGDFVFRNEEGVEIDRASNLKEFLEKIDHIPEESLLYHASRNHFSAWLMARGEIQFARSIQPLTIHDFKNANELRKFIKGVIQTIRVQKVKGRITSFDPDIAHINGVISRLSEGLLGGKGRGIAFLNSLIETHVIPRVNKEVEIKIPQTFIIGTESYRQFWEENHLDFFIHTQMDFHAIKYEFLKIPLPLELQRLLYQVLTRLNGPIAVRSSGLFEDSVTNAFSGIYDTYILPNNHPNIEIRLNQLMAAIRLIYASVFAPQTRAYFESIHYRLEEEQMAILIQELAGSQFGSYFFPHISGVAQSYNFYPIAGVEAEEGLASIALGLGEYVMEGEKTFLFCPRQPQIQLLQESELLQSSQQYFYALNVQQQQFNLTDGSLSTLQRLPISVAENLQALNKLASTWDPYSSKLRPGLHQSGQRVLNFSYILQYHQFPLAEILDAVLDIGKNALGTHVEIEFAVRLNDNSSLPSKGIFYLLQIKPLHKKEPEFQAEFLNPDSDRLLLFTRKGVGNGQLDHLHYLMVVHPQRFDRSRTVQIAGEIAQLNEEMKLKGEKYILMGPGRWGSRDQWLGIPVQWNHISQVACIVEIGLEGFPFEPSMGSHFFHNITSMNIGYFMVPAGDSEFFIREDLFPSFRKIRELPHTTLYYSSDPLTVIMDGRDRKYGILIGSPHS